MGIKRRGDFWNLPDEKREDKRGVRGWPGRLASTQRVSVLRCMEASYEGAKRAASRGLLIPSQGSTARSARMKEEGSVRPLTF